MNEASPERSSGRKKVVVVGLGMVGIAFIEKLLKMDKRKEYDIVVIGEEPYLAYNRVSLTSFFEHRTVEQLYMNTKDWVSLGKIREARIPNVSSTTLCPTERSVII